MLLDVTTSRQDLTARRPSSDSRTRPQSPAAWSMESKIDSSSRLRIEQPPGHGSDLIEEFESNLDVQGVDEILQAVSDQIERSPIQKEWSVLLEAGFEDASWDRLAQHCLGCSICAYVCPSCSCFDVHHEGNAWGGREIRCWDACTHALFTLHASGRITITVTSNTLTGSDPTCIVGISRGGTGNDGSESDLSSESGGTIPTKLSSELVKAIPTRLPEALLS